MQMSDLIWSRLNRDMEMSQPLAGEDGEPFHLSRKLLGNKPTGTPVYEYGLYTTGPVQKLDLLMLRCHLEGAKIYKRKHRDVSWIDY